MLAITLAEPEWRLVLDAALREQAITVDLIDGAIRLANGSRLSFAVASAEREALLNGWDEIDGIQSKYADAILAYELCQRQSTPWLWEKEMTNG